MSLRPQRVGVATAPAPEVARRQRLRWLITVLSILIVLILAATFLPRTRLLPATMRQPRPHPYILARDRAGRWQQDLAYLAAELPRLHVDAFRYISRRDFQQRVATLEANIPTLSDDAIVLGLMNLVAAVGDGHTTLDFTRFYTGEESWRIYPLSIAWLEDAWYVVGAAMANQHLLGAQLVAINDMPVDELFARVAPTVAADNVVQLRNTGATLMMTANVLAALEIVDATTPARFAFTLFDGQAIEVPLEAVVPDTLQLQGLQPPSAGDVPLAQRNPEQWYWYEVLPEANALYFQYDVCADMPTLPFTDFSEALFATVDREGLTRIVVDLRNNGGGNSSVLRPFLEGLAARPDLETYVLIGRRTFSSALMNAIELDQQANAVLVGEPTGGRPNYYGEVRSFTLPNSELRVSYSTRRFRMVDDADPPALEPEIATPVTIANQFAGHDAALAAAIEDQRNP